MKARALLSALAAGTLALTVAGCAADTDKVTTESGAQLVKGGKLTVCTHLPYEPFQYKEDGKIVGFDVDLVDLVAEELDVEQTIVNTPFETIETGQAMSTGKCDLAAAGMTITEERARVMDFSDPYFNATQALLVQKGSGYDSLESLSGKTRRRPGQHHRPGLRRGERPRRRRARRCSRTSPLLTAAVKTGDVDAGINDNGVLYDYADQNSDVEVSTEFDTGEQYGWAVAKDGNDELLEDRQRGAGQGREGRHVREDLPPVLPGRRADDARVTVPGHHRRRSPAWR